MCSLTDRDNFLLTFVHTLCLTGHETEGVPGNLQQNQLDAIQALEYAPFTYEINHTLLLGLHSACLEVINATTKACLSRLTRMNNKDKAELMGLILDTCFLNLTGRRPVGHGSDTNEERRIIQLESAVVRLLKAVVYELLSNPIEYEHHISRILSRARQIQHLEDAQELADVTVQFQHLLADDDSRTYHYDAVELQKQRQSETYESPTSSESSLRAYLENDARLSIRDVPQHLIRLYRVLLSVQSGVKKKAVLLKALDNLTKWLQEVPSLGADEWEDHVQEMVSRARVGVKWETLNLNVVRYLEFQLELLPGSSHSEDLFKMLQNKYAFGEHEEILIAGLRLLAFMPVIRTRVDELTDFILARGKQYRSIKVWRSIIGLIEAHVTGLDDTVLTIEDLTKKDQQLFRVISQILEPDNRMRSLLYQLSTTDGRLSNNPDIEVEVRQTAWRILLRCLPANRARLYQEGLLQHDGRFFLATLQEAASQSQRILWDVLLTHWDELMGTTVPETVRTERLYAVADYFEATRHFDALRCSEDEQGHLIKLALDDRKQEIRELFFNKILAAGYRLEIEKELQRRDILHKRQMLTQSNQKVIKYKDELSRLHNKTVEQQKLKAVHVLDIQTGLQEREQLVTGGWITTSQFQVMFEEVREELIGTLEQAAQEYEALQELQRQMRVELENSRIAANQINGLVKDQKRREYERETLQKQLNNASSQLSGVQSELNNITSQIRNLERSTGFPPPRTGNQETDNRAIDQYNHRVNRIRWEIQALKNQTSKLEGQGFELKRMIEHCENGIERESNEIEHLQGQINKLRSEISSIEHPVSSIRSDFRAVQAKWRKLQQAIEQLRARADETAEQNVREQERTRSELSHNTRAIEKQQQNLRQVYNEIHRLSDLIDQVGHSHDVQVTRSQQLVQAIDSGRHNYEDLAQRAVLESAHANDIGCTKEKRHEQQTVEKQESKVQYAYGVQEALKRQESPPTKEEYKHQKRQAARRRRIMS